MLLHVVKVSHCLWLGWLVIEMLSGSTSSQVAAIQKLCAGSLLANVPLLPSAVICYQPWTVILCAGKVT